MFASAADGRTEPMVVMLKSLLAAGGATALVWLLTLYLIR
jgi:hypothetical protein